MIPVNSNKLNNFIEILCQYYQVKEDIILELFSKYLKENIKRQRKMQVIQ